MLRSLLWDATWCPAIAQAEQAIPFNTDAHRLAANKIYGINYRDKPLDAVRWLAELGNPYKRIGADERGRVGIDWGVYGVPETFIIDREGRIRYRHVGPLYPFQLEETLWPLIRDLTS